MVEEKTKLEAKLSEAKKRSKEEIERTLNPLVCEWFFSRFKEFSETQLYGVMPIFERKNILISAPTGGTKTLTAFLSILNYLVELASKNELEDKIYAVYCSPLRALSNDIFFNLVTPLAEIEEIAKTKDIKLQKIRVGLRTGDTSTADRAKMAKQGVHILVTTPESLGIILASKSFVEKIKAVEFIVVDEIHSLANKRGVHLSLSLEILTNMSIIFPVRIGLSATIEPLNEVARFLTGNRECLIANVDFGKKLDIKVISPIRIEEVSGELVHTELYALLDRLIEEHKTTLIFTNTRSATERVIHHLKEMFPAKYLENIGAHHSSLSKEHRFNLEDRLRKGELKVVVTSTSLELGIDIGYIDLVILLGSPKSTSRAIQRCLAYDSEILCADGKYRKIGEITEKKQDMEVISYDENKGFVKNKIKFWHKNNEEEIIKIKLKCGEELRCTGEHPILTDKGWKKVGELKKEDLIAEIRKEIEFDNKEPYLFELLPKDRIFVANKDNFFQRIIDKYRRNKGVNAKNFSKNFEMPYSRFLDCRRLKGRRKSIKLDYFLKACELCKISKEEYLPYLKNLKTKGKNWPEWPLKLTEEIMWLAGIVATDGCIVRSKKKDEAEYYKIKIGNKSKMMIDKIKEIAEKFKIKPYIAFKREIWQLEFGANLLAYLFMSLGIPCKNKSFDIKLNNKVFSLPSNLIYSYLEGIFEGDGNLNIRKGKNYGVIRIFSASKEFAVGLHRLLSRLGYQNLITKSKIKASKLIKKVSDRDLYCVFFSRKEDLRRFFEKIPRYGEKARKGKLLTKDFMPYLSSKKDYNEFLSYSKIENIEAISKDLSVYNLTLEKEPNNFVVGNIIVHNCGRSGHKLHDIAKGRFVVLDKDDLVECAVMLKQIKERNIDRVKIPKNCLDVLAQQVYAMAIIKIWDVEEMLKVIKQSYCYASLSKEDFFSIISYLSGEYGLENSHVYAKIWYDQESKQIGKRGKLARVIYMTNIGTIPEESFINVVLAPSGEQRIGVIDEGFLGRLKKGDVFVLGGNRYMYLYSRGMKAYVKGSVNLPPTIPSWFSEMLPLSFDLANEINRFRKLIAEKIRAKKSAQEVKEFIMKWCYLGEREADEIYDYLLKQEKYIGIPNEKEIIIEEYRGEKKIFIFHSLYGRRVNDALSRALGFCVARLNARDIEIGINDNGFFFSGEKVDSEKIKKAINFLNSKNIEEVLKEAVDKTEILGRRFRHCAARALMILRSYKGRQKSVGKQQVSSHFLISNVRKISHEFPILREARREVLEDLMDIDNARVVLEWIKEGKVKIRFVETDIPSPFSLNLVMQGYSDLIKIEDKIEFLKRMYKAIEGKIER